MVAGERPFVLFIWFARDITAVAILAILGWRCFAVNFRFVHRVPLSGGVCFGFLAGGKSCSSSCGRTEGVICAEV
jgi:hypothetical protein